jgi:hypothetical protein
MLRAGRAGTAVVGLLMVLIFCLVALLAVDHIGGAPPFLELLQDQRPAAGKRRGFWDDDSALWSGAQQPKLYVASAKSLAAASSSAAVPKRSLSNANHAHKAVVDLAPREQRMQTAIDKLSSTAEQVVKATEQTAASKAGLHVARPTLPQVRGKQTSNVYQGVDLDKVYRKAFDAAFDAAYSGAYKSALGKAEQKLWRQVQKGRKARRELDALEKDKERALVQSKKLLKNKGLLPAVSKAVKDRGEVKAAVLQQKAFASVPLGGASHMRTGQEFTGEHEKYGPLERHCSTGNCEPLEDAGVNVDAWKGLMFGKIHRTIPLPRFDPTEDPVTRRAMAQRTGRFARYNKARADDRVRWGGAVENDPLRDPTWDRLAQHGVNTGSAYFGKSGDLYRVLPLPGLDDTQFDHAKGTGKSPFLDAKDHMQMMRDSDAKLEDAGVVVNRLPAAFASKGFSSVDGVPDKLISPEPLPDYRKGGVALQEQPTFWLSDDANARLNTPQAQESEEGVEEEGKPATQLGGDLSKAGVNVDAWPEKLEHLWDSTVPSTGPKHGFLAQGVMPRKKGLLQK